MPGGLQVEIPFEVAADRTGAQLVREMEQRGVDAPPDLLRGWFAAGGQPYALTWQADLPQGTPFPRASQLKNWAKQIPMREVSVDPDARTIAGRVPVRDGLAGYVIAFWQSGRVLFLGIYDSPDGMEVLSGALLASIRRPQDHEQNQRHRLWFILSGLGMILVSGFGGAWWLRQRDQRWDVS